MACNCLGTGPILERLREQKPDYDISDGEFVQVGFVFGKKTALMTFTEFEYTYTFQKARGAARSKPKTKTINLHHKYCPFCGVEYNPEETEVVNANETVENGN